MDTDILSRNNVHVGAHDGPPMVFAHGFGCDQNMWRYVAPSFERRYRTVLFDYVGAGRSDLAAFNPERYATLHGYAQDVIEVLDALDLQKVTFVGHSVSGMIGMLAAIAQPERFSRLIMIAPSPCYIDHPPDYIGGFDRKGIEELLDLMDRNYLGWAHFLAPVVMGNDNQPDLASELEQSFCSTDRRTARVFAQATFLSDHRKDLARLTTPSLLLQCANDVIAPPAVGDFLHRHLADSTLRVLDVSGHCPHMSHPQQTIAAIEGYLSATA